MLVSFYLVWCSVSVVDVVSIVVLVLLGFSKLVSFGWFRSVYTFLSLVEVGGLRLLVSGLMV